jgi:SAM-dependent methyltransferase
VILVIRDGAVVASVPLEEYRDFEFRDGDHLEVVDETVACAVTFDGQVNVRLESGDTLRIPRTWKSYDFRGYRMPGHLLFLTGTDFGGFESAGRSHVANYKRFLSLSESHDVLEIGCGIGKDAIQLMSPRQVYSYLGIDVMQDSIAWCTKNLTKSDPRFKFAHFDAYHELYNPLGSKKTTDFAIPCEDSSIDKVIVYSVFTHLFEDEVSHYLREIFRVLRPGGLVYASVFVYSDDVIASARELRRVHEQQYIWPKRTKHQPMTFEIEHSEGCYVDDARLRSGSVAYTRQALDRMIRDSGLLLVGDYLPGNWSGHYKRPKDGAEVAILVKPDDVEMTP